MSQLLESVKVEHLLHGYAAIVMIDRKCLSLRNNLKIIKKL